MSTPQHSAYALRDLADPIAGAHGLVVEDVVVKGVGSRSIIQVVVDLPEEEIGSAPLDWVADTSRELSAALDASDIMGETSYVLEVTTPGVSRPLTEPRHFRRARTRLVTVKRPDGTAVSGRLTDVDDDGLQLDAQGGPVRLAWTEVDRGSMDVEFNRP